jgi:hypothetical protein
VGGKSGLPSGGEKFHTKFICDVKVRDYVGATISNKRITLSWIVGKGVPDWTESDWSKIELIGAVGYTYVQ